MTTFGPVVLVMAAVVAWSVTAVIVRSSHWHHHLTADHDLNGVQKFHAQPVPRIGGVSILLALLLAWSASWLWEQQSPDAVFLLLAGLPAFATGLAEDLTKRVGVLPRLLATGISAAWGMGLVGSVLNRLGIPGVDDLLSNVPFLAWVLTMVAVAGVANAINIIDGFNGLASGSSILMFSAFGLVAWQLEDALLLQVCLTMIGALLGFMAWNWPGGKIFLGDGGAYLVGFVLAEVAVLLVVRHPQVSPWFCLLVCSYPVTETLFSIYRRRFLRDTSPGHPDGLHLHTLVFKRLVRHKRTDRKTLTRNSATSPYLWTLTAITVVPAVLWWQYPAVMVVSCALFVLVYIGFYRMIVTFGTPKWLIRRLN